MSWLSDLLGGATTGLIPSEITNIYNTPLPQVTAPDISFQPFGVTTSGLGGVSTTATGGTAFNLSPEQKALQNQLFGQAGTMLGQVPTAGASLGTAGQNLLNLGQQAYGQTPGSALYNYGANQLGQAPGTYAMLLGQQALGQTPYGLGSTQAAAQQAYGLGSDFMTQAGMPTGAREQAIYERMRAAQTPEEERQRMALEERLFAQGRGGVTTNQYGGTPEQLAMAKAQAEAQNTAMLGAMQQAQREQAQQGALGAQYAGLGSSLTGQSQALTAAQQAQALQALQSGQGMNLAQQQAAMQALQGGQGMNLAQQQQALAAMQGGQGMLQGQLGLQQGLQGMGLAAMQAGYAPQANLLNALQGGLNVASMADVARRQQGEYGLQTQIANMQGALGQQQGLANLYGGVYGGLLGGLGGLVGAAADPLASSFGEWLGGLFD
jgi:hypothetical protein